MTTLSARIPQGIRPESARKTYRIPLSSSQPASQAASQPETGVGYSLRNRYRFLTATGGKTTGNGHGGVA